MDVREAMEAAQEQLDSQAETVTEAPAPVETTSTPAPETAAAEPAAEKTAAQRARDESGRFAAKPKEETKVTEKPAAGAPKAALPPPPAAAQGKPVEVPSTPPPVASTGQPVRAPQSWKPATRELAAKLPAEFHPILEEANRREVETNRVMQETAQARQVAQQTHQALAPYEPIARMAGKDAWSWAGEALQSAAVLQSGSPQQKAQAFAQMLSRSGVDTEMVNAYLQGQQPAQTPQAYQPVDPRAIFREELQALQQHAQQTQADQVVSSFLATHPEFINDVWPDMVAVLNAAKAAGRNMTPEQAYDRACRMNEGVIETLQQRKAAEAARTPKPVTEQQRRAASSVRSQPAAAPAAQPKGIRGAMEAAAEKLGM